VKPLFLNGKFYAGELNGVHRVADRLIRELDALLTAASPDERPDATLFIPARRRWAPELQTIKIVEEPRGHSQLWEQFILPGRARGGLLVNLCNLAPILHRDKILMLHDAQFLFPDSSYPARLRWGYRFLTPLMARSSKAVLTVSEYSRQMLDLLGVSPRALTLVQANGADHMLDTPAKPEIVARLGLSPGRYAVHIASAKVYKNTAVVFEAFSDPALADVGLVLVGPGKDDLARAGLVAPANALFAGRVDDGELRGLYEQAACLLFPSRTEGFGLPPIEAMMVGCPAVVSPAGAIPEACHDAALYADVDHPEAWVRAIRTYVDDPAARTLKVEAGRVRASQFRWAETARRFEQTIRRHLVEHPGA
jgi:glycosyltransferase involved in cell wall biosynthesis